MTKIAKGFRPTHRHIKSGNLYSIIGRGHDCTNGNPPRPVVLYEDEIGGFWVRSAPEFDDGRFEELPLAAAPVSPLEEAVARLIEAARTEWHDADCNMSSMRLWHSGCNCLRKDIEEALHVIDAITQEKPHG